MDWLKRITYMAIGVLLVTLVVFGVATFAQDDGDTEAPAGESEDPAGAETTDEGAETTVPDSWQDGRLGHEDEYLAEALGISVEELQAAYEEVRIAAIEQAVEEGALTEEQAEALLSGTDGFHGRLGHGFRIGGLDVEVLLAEALNISADALRAARAEALASKLDAMVEAGHLTQEEADLIAARDAVESYFDRDAVAAMIQEAYESAVAEALADGVITQEQADHMLENIPAPDGFRLFDGGFRGHGRHGRPGIRGGPGGPFFDSGLGTPSLEAPADA